MVLSVEVYFSYIFWYVCPDAGLICLLKYYYNLYNTMALAVELYFCNISWCLCPDTAFKILICRGILFCNISWSLYPEAGLIYLLKYYDKYNTMATVHWVYLEIFNRIQSVTIVASGTKMNMSCWPVNGFHWTQRRRTLDPQSRESCSSLENTRYTLMESGGGLFFYK